MTARAHLAIEAVPGTPPTGEPETGTLSRVGTLRSQGPLVLRPLGAHGDAPLIERGSGAARVSLASAAAGPLGGDDFGLDVTVGAGATLLLTEISSTLLLPGARGRRSHMRITIDVQDDATLVWLPQPVIAARGCDHHHDIEITVGERARVLMRDELVLGRYGEEPGRLRQHLNVRSPGRSICRQHLDLGHGSDAWASPAVLGGHRCVGTVLAVDASRQSPWPEAELIEQDAALLPLARGGAMISALANDAVTLGHLLDEGMDRLGAPWRLPGRTETMADLPGPRRRVAEAVRI